MRISSFLIFYIISRVLNSLNSVKRIQELAYKLFNIFQGILCFLLLLRSFLSFFTIIKLSDINKLPKTLSKQEAKLSKNTTPVNHCIDLESIDKPDWNQFADPVIQKNESIASLRQFKLISCQLDRVD